MFRRCRQALVPSAPSMSAVLRRWYRRLRCRQALTAALIRADRRRDRRGRRAVRDASPAVETPRSVYDPEARNSVRRSSDAAGVRGTCPTSTVQTDFSKRYCFQNGTFLSYV